MSWLVTLLVGISLYIFYFLFRRMQWKQNNYPPGPPGLPIVGYAPYLRPNKYLVFEKLGNRFGDVFSVPFFSQRVVILHSIAAIRQALITNASCFSLRPRFAGQVVLRKNRGILNSDGPVWQEHRRFALKTLRDFGFAKALSLDAIHQELQALIDMLERKEGQPISTKMPFAKMTTNVICRTVFGQRLSENEEQCEYMLNLVIQVVQSGLKGNILNLFPFLAKIPFFTEWYIQHSARGKTMLELFDFMRSNVREHINSIGDISEARDFTDALILHKIALEQQNVTEHTFDEHGMVMDLFDLFAAGTDTTSVTLSWAVLLMSLHPEVQDKTRQEIHKVLGSNSFPTMQDRPKLNYTLAVIDEVNRFATIVPGALVHRTEEDVVICGRTIPKNASVIPNIFAVHHDPKLWKSPNTFDPGNFLNSNGDYKTSDNLIPFSIGKRACLGESLARMEIFVFFVGLMQRYQVSLAERESLDIKSLLMGMDTVVRHLNDHKIIFNAVSEAS